MIQRTRGSIDNGCGRCYMTLKRLTQLDDVGVNPMAGNASKDIVWCFAVLSAKILVNCTPCDCSCSSDHTHTHTHTNTHILLWLCKDALHFIISVNIMALSRHPVECVYYCCCCCCCCCCQVRVSLWIIYILNDDNDYTAWLSERASLQIIMLSSRRHAWSFPLTNN